jgi:hypothetical protein
LSIKMFFFSSSARRSLTLSCFPMIIFRFCGCGNVDVFLAFWNHFNRLPNDLSFFTPSHLTPYTISPRPTSPWSLSISAVAPRLTA